MIQVRIVPDPSRKHKLALYALRYGQANPFVDASPFDYDHAERIKKKFEEWARQGWPYSVE